MPRAAAPPSAAALGVMLAVLAAVLVVCSPAAAADRDRDGLRDGFEARWGVTDPSMADTDGDGVVDSAEDGDGDRLSALGEQRFNTNPGRKDSDADGQPDGSEDHDLDGRSDAREQDQRPVPTVHPTLADAPKDVWARGSTCVVGEAGSGARRCILGDPDATVGLAVVGDSKAAMFMPAISLAAERLGWRVTTLLKGACSPILGTLNSQAHDFDDGEACRAWREHAIDWLQTHPPSLIAYVHSDDYRLVDGRGRTISGRQKSEAWRSGSAKTIAALPASSRVLLLGDVPKNEANPVRCLRDHGRDMSRCATRRQPLSERTIEVVLRQVASDVGASFGTLHDQVCSYDPCPLVQGDTLMWRDQRHLTTTFARRLAPSMQAVLADALAGAP
jgi:hypothetical protein